MTYLRDPGRVTLFYKNFGLCCQELLRGGSEQQMNRRPRWRMREPYAYIVDIYMKCVLDV